MARKELINNNGNSEYEEQSRKKGKQSPDLLKANEKDISSETGFTGGILAGEQTYDMPSAASNTDLTGTVMNLQQSCGNAYVQHMMGRLQDSNNIAPPQAKTGPANSYGNDGTGTSVTMAARLKCSNNSVKEDDSPLDVRQTGNLCIVPAAYDAIRPATINLNQQTMGGGNPGGTMGSVNILYNENVHTEKLKGSYLVTINLGIQYKWGISSQGRADIPNANVPAVTQDKWTDIIYDLTPSAESIPRSPRTQYWCSDLTAIHEQYHAMDYTQAYNSFSPIEQAWLSQQDTASKGGAERWGLQALERLKARVANYMGEGDFSPQESRAYSHGAPLYEARAEAVQNRAEAESWCTPNEEDEAFGWEVTEEEDEDFGYVVEEDDEGEEVEEEEELEVDTQDVMVSTDEEEEEEDIGEAVGEALEEEEEEEE